jgi:hypothetical protein
MVAGFLDLIVSNTAHTGLAMKAICIEADCCVPQHRFATWDWSPKDFMGELSRRREPWACDYFCEPSFEIRSSARFQS